MAVLQSVTLRKYNFAGSDKAIIRTHPNVQFFREFKIHVLEE